MEIKQVILVCDWCPARARAHAVAQLTLVNGLGTKGGLAADLCEKCNKKARRLFRKRGGATTPPPTPSERAGKGKTRGGEARANVGGGAGKRKSISHVGHARGQARRAKILEIATTPMKKVDIAAKTGMKGALTSWYIKDLVASNQLKQIGRGNATTYVRA
jgi:hypothetical protein